MYAHATLSTLKASARVYAGGAVGYVCARVNEGCSVQSPRNSIGHICCCLCVKYGMLNMYMYISS